MPAQTLVVASRNPVKVAAALGGLQRLFPDAEFVVESVDVSSGVADQPMTDEETLRGAQNRVENARLARPDAHFWVGLEGGVELLGDELAAFAWVIVRSEEQLGRARSGTFFLPPVVKDLVVQGMELGAADDVVFGKSNSKQQGGAIGLLTGNVLDRRELYEQAVVLAALPFRNQELYVSEAVLRPSGAERE